VWQRAVLAAGVLLYLGAKGYRLRKAHKAVRQLRLEECFIGLSFDGQQLRRCVQRRGHLWTHSYTVRALRRLMMRPLPSLLLTDKKHQRVGREYRHTLDRMRPSRLTAGLLLAVLLAGGVLAGVLGTVGPLPAWPLRLGLASVLVVLVAEAAQVGYRHRARRFFERLTETLTDWTLAHSVYDLLHGRQPTSYRHTPLYRAPAWFATPAAGRPAAPGETGDSASPQRRAA
jgi:hypothetical protein